MNLEAVTDAQTAEVSHLLEKLNCQHSPGNKLSPGSAFELQVGGQVIDRLHVGLPILRQLFGYWPEPECLLRSFLEYRPSRRNFC
jgi:hypothetical protein